MPANQALLANSSAAPDVSVTLQDFNTTKATTNGTPATAWFRVDNDGKIYTNQQSASGVFTWLGTGVVADFEVRVTQNTGDAITGSALNTWYSCSADRTFNLVAPVDSETAANLTVTFRKAANGATLGSCIADLSATSVLL